MRYLYRTTIYKVGGNLYKEFIINSNDSIRKACSFIEIVKVKYIICISKI